MCLSSFFQFPLFVIACVEELETTNATSSTPQDMVNASTKPHPSLLLLLGCLFLVLAIIPPEAIASPISSAEPHHRHTRPWAAWHRTTHVRRDIPMSITAGAELPDTPASSNGYWVINNNLPTLSTDGPPASIAATEIISPFRLPRDLLARTYECWKGGKLCSCVMHVLHAGEEADS